jgi:methyltransferase
MIGSILLLAFVTVERIAELFLARRNTVRLLARGGIEHSAGHYPIIVALHTLWLLGLWALAWDRPIDIVWLSAFAVLQILRFWVLATLQGRWTTRIITVPNEILVRRGPYRFISHPNYVVVICEIAILPMAFGLWQYALLFSILNAAILSVRIRAEDRALGDTASMTP